MIYPLMSNGTEKGRVNECKMDSVSTHLVDYGRPHRHTFLFSYSLHAGEDREMINNYYRHSVVCKSNTQ